MTAVITNAPNISSFCNIGRALLHEKASGGTVDANGAERRGNQDSEHRHRKHQLSARQTLDSGTEPMAACTVAFGR